MSRKYKTVTAIVVIVVILVIFIRNAGLYLIKSSEPVNTGVALLLMGSIPDRVMQAADLFHKGSISKFLIIEENMGGLSVLRQRGFHFFSNSEQAGLLLQQIGIPDSLITIIPGYASSTLEEAVILRNWLQNSTLPANTLTIISSAHHMRRAGLIFNKVLNKKKNNYILYYIPSKYTHFEAKKWYLNKEDIQKVISEYLKIASFLLIEQWQIPESEVLQK